MNKYIYEITNLITKQKYIGIRECDCEVEKDKYKGENTILLKDFKKYGKKNFIKRTLAIILVDEMTDELLDIYTKYENATLLEELSTESSNQKKTRNTTSSAIFKKVICLNTGEIFNTITEASNKYKTSKSGIIQACNPNHKANFAGKTDIGEKLMWDYYDAYIAKSNGEDYVYSPSKMTPKNIKLKPVRCIETGEEFESLKEAAEAYGISSGAISNSCTTGNHAGKHPDNKTPLSWEYVNKEDSNYYNNID